MKKIILTISFLVSFSILLKIFSNPNPLVPHYISEFMFDTTGWKLEVHPDYFGQDSILLDGWYLTNKSDTAYFSEGIYIRTEECITIDQSDLQSQFNIDETSDSIELRNDWNGLMDWLYFGNANFNYINISTPEPGQSIRKHPYDKDIYILDNTPTLGLENDTSNIKGYTEGFIKDTINNPLENVKVIYDYAEMAGGYYIPVYVLTNSSGYFIFNDYAKLARIEFEKDSYYAPDTLLQIWPDSTVTINIQMTSVTGITELPTPPINNFELMQNYPNPFNSSTTFIYSLAEEGYIEINIYDEKGELIQKIFNGNQSKGKYKVNWNAENLASGIYFYELKTKNQKISKKCLLLK